MSQRPTIPTQTEVDSIAAFIEAAQELQQEPFFGPDEKLVFGHDGKNHYYQFGDRFHFRSALVSFRRIWLNDEASHFYRVIKIICKYQSVETSDEMWIPTIREECRRIEEGSVTHAPELNTKRLVDLWLNAVFAHNNIAQKHGDPKRFDRTDFERYSDKLQHAFFEYSFRMAIRQFGLCYRNLLILAARPTLASWKDEFRLSPSFKIGAPFGDTTEEETKDGIRIIRRASTQFGGPESPEEKLSRILSRHEFSQFSNVLRHLEVPNLLESIKQAASYKALLEKSGFQITLVTVVDRNQIREDMRNHNAYALIPCHNRRLPDSDTAFYIGKKIVTEQRSVDFFEAKFASLKKLLSS